MMEKRSRKPEISGRRQRCDKQVLKSVKTKQVFCKYVRNKRSVRDCVSQGEVVHDSARQFWETEQFLCLTVHQEEKGETCQNQNYFFFFFFLEQNMEND